MKITEPNFYISIAQNSNGEKYCYRTVTVQTGLCTALQSPWESVVVEMHQAIAKRLCTA